MIASLADAWHWCESVRALAFTLGRLGQRYWDGLPWGGELGRDSHLRDVESLELVNQSKTVLGDLDDLCVLFLFSVFEAIVRARVQQDIAAEIPVLRHPALQHAVNSLKESIEHGSFFRVLEPYKGTDADLIEKVNQVRRYRNWVAHGRHGEKPENVDPSTAFERLNLFLQRVLGLPANEAS